MEADQLEQIRLTDMVYTAVKNVGQCVGDGAQGVWDEHTALRAEWMAAFGVVGTAPTPTLTREDHLALAVRIQGQLQAAGILPPTGVNH